MRILTYALCDSVVKRIRDALAERFEVVAANRKAFLSPANRDAIYLLNITRNTDLLSFFIGFHMYAILWVLRRKVVVYFSTDFADLCKSRLGKAFFGLVNRVIFASARLVVLLRNRGHIAKRYGLPSDRVLYVDNFPAASFLDRVEPRQDERFAGKVVFLYHGSFLWWHGFHKFLPTYERIRQMYPDAQLVIMGSVRRNAFLDRFAYEREFFDRIDRLKQRNDIVWVPAESVADDEVASYVARADFHVSQMDNKSVQGDTELRTCLLEAMALGVPCLHADSHAIRTHPEFRDGENIVLIDPDDPDAAAERICGLIDDPAERRRIGENARRTIRERYDFDAWLDRVFIPALERLAGERSRADDARG